MNSRMEAEFSDVSSETKLSGPNSHMAKKSKLDQDREKKSTPSENALQTSEKISAKDGENKADVDEEDKTDEMQEPTDTRIDDETVALDAEVAKTFQNRYNLSMSAVCGGLLGKLESETCANPNAAADEIRFFKRRGKRSGNAFRLRPKTPVRRIAKRNRDDASPSSPEDFKEKVAKFTEILSPVCGDDSLALLLMSGYKYASPMSRHIRVPVLGPENWYEDELESEICQECIFCQREKVRHHKVKKDESFLVRQLRSPCRCFHECIPNEDKAEHDEPDGKKYILERFLADKPSESPEFKVENDDTEEQFRIEEEVADDNESVEVIDVQEKNKANTEIIQIMNVESETIPILTGEAKHSSENRKRVCHSEHSTKHPAKRISVITPNASTDTCSAVGTSATRCSTPSAIYPRYQLAVSSKTPLSMESTTNSQYNHQIQSRIFSKVSSHDSVVKIENPNNMEAYGIAPANLYPYGASGSTASSRSTYTLPPTGQESRSFMSSRSHQMCHYGVQPHQQQVYTQEDVNRMLAPAHPPRISACIERLAHRFKTSRSRPEHNEKQVTELLQLACEVRREEECETFYCTWIDCIKHFNRRDSLVRHLRVHVNVRPFKCERCDQRFLRSDHLRVHMLRHTGEQPFACIICGQTFARKDLRNRHMKTIHYPEEMPPQKVLDLLDGTDWNAIEKDPDMLRKA